MNVDRVGRTYNKTLGQLRDDPLDVPPRTGHVAIEFDTIWGQGQGQVVPVVEAALERDAIEQGESLAIDLQARDPDGHAIRFYEVIWGDGPDARASTQRFFAGERAAHRYDQPGVYVVRVAAYNEHGIAGYRSYTVRVAPRDRARRSWTFLVAPELAPGALEVSGLYECRVLINGVQVYAFDWGSLAHRGWRSVVVDAEPSLQGAESFELGLEIRALREARAEEPHRVVFYVDNLALWGEDEGLEAQGAAWSEMDPLFDARKGSRAPNTQWGAYDGGAEIRPKDTPSDHGEVLYGHFSGNQVGPGDGMRWTSEVGAYMHAPRELAASDEGDDVAITWRGHTLATHADVRVLRRADGALVHEALGVEEAGGYRWRGGGVPASELRVQVRSLAPHRADASAFARSQAASWPPRAP